MSVKYSSINILGGGLVLAIFTSLITIINCQYFIILLPNVNIKLLLICCTTRQSGNSSKNGFNNTNLNQIQSILNHKNPNRINVNLFKKVIEQIKTSDSISKLNTLKFLCLHASVDSPNYFYWLLLEIHLTHSSQIN